MKYFYALLLTIGLASQAQAATGLAMSCDNITAPAPTASCTGTRTYIVPQAGKYVLSYPSAPTDSTTVAWGDANLQFRLWDTLPATYGVLTCTKDLSSTQVAIPAAGPDQCAPGNDAVAKVFVLKSAVSLGAAYTATKTLSWTTPTTNADGTALTDLAHYNVYMGATAANLLLVGSAVATSNTFTTQPMSPGTYYFAVTTVNLANAESVYSNIVTGTIAKPSATPSPPKSLVVQ